MAKKKEKIENNIKKEEEPEKVAKEDNIEEERKQETKKNEEIIEEKTNLEEKNEPKALIAKKEIEIDQEKLQKIEEEIKKQTTITEQKKSKIHKKIGQNMLLGIGIICYFLFLNLGFHNIKAEIFLKDLQVFSLIAIGTTIVVFEKAYKKEKGEIAIYGIELLIVSICTLISIYVKTNEQEKFTYLINGSSIVFAIYYIVKCSIIYRTMRKKALKRTSDIHKIGRVKE